eukprot:11611970-Ditylum_brightwellii.AAC.1
MEELETLYTNDLLLLRSENVIITKPWELHLHSSILDMISDPVVISARDVSNTEKYTYGNKLLQICANLNLLTEEFSILADKDLNNFLDDLNH